MSGCNGYGAFARYYDVLTGNVDYPARAAYFDALARRFRGDDQTAEDAAPPRLPLLLDLACGTGSLTLELARLGYEVIGADASEEMLSAATRKADEAEDLDGGPRPLFLRQAMTELDLYGTVDVTVCALDSLNHLPGEAALAETLRRVALFTRPGGLFLFDVNTAYKHREVLAGSMFVYEPEGLYCVWQNEYYAEDGRVEIALDFFEERADGGWRRSGERFTERVFAPEVLERLLAETGFEVSAVFGDDSMEPPGPETQRAVYVTRREKVKN